MSQITATLVERRIFMLGAGLIAAGGATAWFFFGAKPAISLLAGGVLAALNMAWLRQTVQAITLNDAKTSKYRVLAGFFLRLLLIPLCLYAMIRFLFWTMSAAVAGFALFHCGLFLEGILEALNRSNRKHARTE
jgi:hypothetical protein